MRISTEPRAGRQDAAAHRLHEQGVVTDAALRRAEAARAADPGRPELLDHLLAAGALTRDQAHQVIASLFRGEGVCDLSAYPAGQDVENLLPLEAARRLGALPLRRNGGIVEVAVCDPYDLGLLAELTDCFGGALQPQLVLSDAHAIYARIAEMDGEGEPEPEPEIIDVGDLTERAATEAGGRPHGGGNAVDFKVRESAVSQLTTLILNDAIRRGASDIHIEFFPGHGWVRMRFDGVLQEWGKLPVALEQDLVGHIKARASGMDSVNRHTPQDGRLTMPISRNGRAPKLVEFRVSTVPTVIGEKAVLRVVDDGSRARALTDLGFSGTTLEILQRAMNRAWGMILVTGPTGSGKTTTLYSILAALARPQVNIVTVEDPVESMVPMVTHVPIRNTEDKSKSVTFAAMLRSLLRQDPNILMVGEIRDPETAATAARAAMTGHLLLSTLHTNDAPSAVSRLLDLEVEPYNVAGTVRLVVAQRLVRKICEHCKEPRDPDPAMIALSGIEPRRLTGIRFMGGRGCDACGQTGYRGRIGLFEMLEVDDTIARLIAQRRSDKEIAAAALANHMQPLRQAGWVRVRAGETTLEEILKETDADLPLHRV